MKIFVGSAPSSGSTHLATLLDRHPDIYCAPELFLFGHCYAHARWPVFKWHAQAGFPNGLPDIPQGVPVILRDTEALGLARRQACRMMLAEPDFRAYADRLAGHVARAVGKPVFAEKTPSNIYCARQLLDWPDSHVVELVRHPLDMVNSLVRKGTALLDAIGFWMGAVTAGRMVEGNGRHHPLRYEALRDDPLATMNGLMARLGLPVYDAATLADPARNTVAVQYRGNSAAWNHSPGDLGRPGNGNAARNLLVRLPNYRLSRRFADSLGIDRLCLAELAELAGYPLETVEPNYAYRWPRPALPRRRWRWYGRVYGLKVPEILNSE